MSLASKIAAALGWDWQPEFNVPSPEECVDEAVAAVREDFETACFAAESRHHFHGQACLCGFESARSRSRTEHITSEVRRLLFPQPSDSAKP